MSALTAERLETTDESLFRRSCEQLESLIGRYNNGQIDEVTYECGIDVLSRLTMGLVGDLSDEIAEASELKFDRLDQHQTLMSGLATKEYMPLVQWNPGETYLTFVRISTDGKQKVSVKKRQFDTAIKAKTAYFKLRKMHIASLYNRLRDQ